MDIKTAINEALARPMDRRKFIFQIGALLLAIVGITTLLKRLEAPLRSSRSADANAYGGYGGRSTSRTSSGRKVL